MAALITALAHTIDHARARENEREQSVAPRATRIRRRGAITNQSTHPRPSHHLHPFLVELLPRTATHLPSAPSIESIQRAQAGKKAANTRAPDSSGPKSKASSKSKVSATSRAAVRKKLMPGQVRRVDGASRCVGNATAHHPPACWSWRKPLGPRSAHPLIDPVPSVLRLRVVGVMTGNGG